MGHGTARIISAHARVVNQFAETEIPVRYWGEPEDLAVMAVFLASPLARYVTGTVIPVDGGLRRYQF